MADRLERLAILAGAIAGVLWVVGVIVLEVAGNPAGPADGAEIADFYRNDRTAILVAATLHALGGFLFLWFVAALRHVLDAGGSPRWLATAVVVGGTSGGTLMLALMGGHATGATTDTELVTPDAAIVFWRIAHAFFIAAEVALAVFLGALTIVALRRLVFPRWLGWFGLAVTVLLLVPPIGWAALLFLLPLWLIAASLVLWRRAASTAPAAPG